jgi:hypothetical protein
MKYLYWVAAAVLLPGIASGRAEAGSIIPQKLRGEFCVHNGGSDVEHLVRSRRGCPDIQITITSGQILAEHSVCSATNVTEETSRTVVELTCTREPYNRVLAFSPRKDTVLLRSLEGEELDSFYCKYATTRLAAQAFCKKD